MPHHSLPRGDQPLCAWAANFTATLQADPQRFGFTSADLAPLVLRQAAFAAALAVTSAPDTRCAPAVTHKSETRAALLQTLRPLARQVQALLALPDADRVALGLPLHATHHRRIPPPTTAPLLTIAAFGHGSLSLLLQDTATPTRRARPSNTLGAQIYSRLTAISSPPSAYDTPLPVDVPNPAPPDPASNPAHWTLQGLATRSNFTVHFPPIAAGQTAHLATRWLNPRGQPGPWSAPISHLILGSGCGLPSLMTSTFPLARAA